MGERRGEIDTDREGQRGGRMKEREGGLGVGWGGVGWGKSEEA